MLVVPDMWVPSDRRPMWPGMCLEVGARRLACGGHVVVLGHTVASPWLLLLYLSPWLGRQAGVPWVWPHERVESTAAGYGRRMRGTAAA